MAGSLLLDIPRLLPALLMPEHWARAGNRRERLVFRDGGVSTEHLGPDGTDLHAANIYPWVGRRLMHQALRQWQVRLDKTASQDAADPDVSFVVPFRGAERLDALRLVVASILSQQGASVECIVVEQSRERDAEDLGLPVRYLHLPYEQDPGPWRKSLAFNVGVRQARARIVVCHDGDILVPEFYAREILRRMREPGSEVAHLHRFLWYLDERSTRLLAQGASLSRIGSPEKVRQNWRGGTLAITREAFEAIGGYDESFTDWGGEDDEFYDRCLLLKGWRYGYLPFIHLWHSPQSTKSVYQNEGNRHLLEEKMRLSRRERISRLR